jgi:hypothetical protein
LPSSKNDECTVYLGATRQISGFSYKVGESIHPKKPETAAAMYAVEALTLTGSLAMSWRDLDGQEDFQQQGNMRDLVDQRGGGSIISGYWLRSIPKRLSINSSHLLSFVLEGFLDPINLCDSDKSSLVSPLAVLRAGLKVMARFHTISPDEEIIIWSGNPSKLCLRVTERRLLFSF